jgi:chromosome segregation ATPase
VEQQLSEITGGNGADAGALDRSMRALWERAQLAAEVIARLRDEKNSSEHRVHDLEVRLRKTEQELKDAQEQLKAQPPAQVPPDDGRARVFANGEREALAGKVKDLLAKLDAYL